MSLQRRMKRGGKGRGGRDDGGHRITNDPRAFLQEAYRIASTEFLVRRPR